MIIYFSGTGNSFSIAKRLGEKINEQVIPLKRAFNNGDENIIFVFPLYCEDIPPHVRKFLGTFKINNNQNVMAICTSGGGIGNAEYTFNRIMEKKGLIVKKFLSAPMIDNSFPVLFGGEVNRVFVDEDAIVNRFMNMTYNNSSSFNPMHKVTELLVYNSLTKRLFRKKVDKEKCIGCGKCEQICPNNNIQILNNTAVVKDDCTECFGCIHICPQQAIYVRKKVQKKNQYINENIDVNELNK
ncbi:EFR1 family ferrodoxin [Anaeromicrobium sediminis]|uniref:Ferredoxin n=1 Tax=Anaeromicrobium sediminis TaxID=1478221 RepID=A0A267MI87_9FIRM|nr:EFR1 family ferrodoxin [Anaeromicrobium sediminis]PAB59294.1 hypothetical protein CCE28_10540 [Anaeromicrobium sediminis]